MLDRLTVSDLGAEFTLAVRNLLLQAARQSCQQRSLPRMLFPALPTFFNFLNSNSDSATTSKKSQSRHHHSSSSHGGSSSKQAAEQEVERSKVGCLRLLASAQEVGCLHPPLPGPAGSGMPRSRFRIGSAAARLYLLHLHAPNLATHPRADPAPAPSAYPSHVATNPTADPHPRHLPIAPPMTFSSAAVPSKEPTTAAAAAAVVHGNGKHASGEQNGDGANSNGWHVREKARVQQLEEAIDGIAAEMYAVALQEPHIPMMQLGLDSLDLRGLCESLNGQLALQLTPGEIINCATYAGLKDYLISKSGDGQQ